MTAGRILTSLGVRPSRYGGSGMLRAIRRHRVVSRTLLAVWVVVFFYFTHLATRLVVADPYPTTDYVALLGQSIAKADPKATNAWPMYRDVVRRLSDQASECATKHGIPKRQLNLEAACRGDWSDTELEPYRELLARLTPILRETEEVDPSSYFLMPLRPMKRMDGSVGPASIRSSMPLQALSPVNGGDHLYAAALRFNVEEAGWTASTGIIDAGFRMARIMATAPTRHLIRHSARCTDSLLAEIRHLVLEHPPTRAESELILAALGVGEEPLHSRENQLRVFEFETLEGAEVDFGPDGTSASAAGSWDWNRDALDRVFELPYWLGNFRSISSRRDYESDANVAAEELRSIKGLSARELVTYRDGGRRRYYDNARRHGRRSHLEILSLQFGSVLESWVTMFEVENAFRATRITVKLAAFEHEFGRPARSLAELGLTENDELTVQGSPFVYAMTAAEHSEGSDRSAMSLRSEVLENRVLRYPNQTREFLFARSMHWPQAK